MPQAQLKLFDAPPSLPAGMRYSVTFRNLAGNT
jgi:hypothetical protein